jgi:hypothetical protein
MAPDLRETGPGARMNQIWKLHRTLCIWCGRPSAWRLAGVAVASGHPTKQCSARHERSNFHEFRFVPPLGTLLCHEAGT